MRKTIFLLFWLGACVSSSFAQVLKISASSNIVCKGSDVTLYADYGSATSLQWEYSNDGVHFYSFKNQLSKTLVVTMDDSYAFRLRSGLSTSASISVSVREPYVYNWSKSDGTPVQSGEKIYVCDKVENFSFGHTVVGDPVSFYDQFKCEWALDGTIISEGHDLLLPLVDKNCKLTQIITDKYCPSLAPFEFNFEVHPLATAELTVDKESVCAGSDISLSAQTTNATSVVWHKQYDSEPSNQTIKTTTGSGTAAYTPTESGLYWLTVPSDGVCPEIFSDMVRVEVVEPFEHEWKSIDYNRPLQSGDELVYCGTQDVFPAYFFDGRYVNDSAKIASYVTSEWFLDGVKYSDTYSCTFYNIDKNCKLTNVLTTKGCEPIPFDFNIVIKDQPQVAVEDAAVCDGTSATLKAEGANDNTYQWYADAEHRQLVGSGQELNVTPAENTTYYLLAKNDGDCETEKEVTVSVGKVPTVTNSQEVNETTYRLEVEGGTGEISFDYGEGWVTTDVFAGAEPERTYKILVKDELGCQSEYLLETQQYELEFPEYLTPTSMPWLVTNLDKYKVVRIDIFDRVGRLLYSSTDPLEGWYGTYQGHDMPSTDYWYVVNVADKDKQYVGHFTLRR